MKKLINIGLISLFLFLFSCNNRIEQNKIDSIEKCSTRKLRGFVEKFIQNYEPSSPLNSAYSVYFQTYNNGIITNLCELNYIDSISLLKASDVFVFEKKLFLLHLPIEIYNVEEKKNLIDSIKRVFDNKTIFEDNNSIFNHPSTISFLILNDSLIFEENYLITPDQYIIFKKGLLFESPGDSNIHK